MGMPALGGSMKRNGSDIPPKSTTRDAGRAAEVIKLDANAKASTLPNTGVVGFGNRDTELAEDTATLLERIAQALVDTWEYVDGWLRTFRMIETVFAAVGAVGALMLVINAYPIHSWIGLVASIAAFLAPLAFVISRACHATLGKRRSEPMLAYAFHLNQHAYELRMTLSEHPDETTKRLLRSQLASASATLNVVKIQMPFVKKLLECTSQKERRRIMAGFGDG